MERTVYADHHATTPMRREAFEAMVPWLTESHGNPSSTHAMGRAARRAVEEARATAARCLDAAAEEVVFTSGGTESDVLAVVGAARAARAADPRRLRVVIGGAEHAAVREAAKLLEREGFLLTELPADARGIPAAPPELDESVALVSVLLANNETGAVFEGFPELSRRARASGAVSHTDAVQAIGKMDVSFRTLDVDLLSMTAHKLGGPKGAGVLVVRKGTRLQPLASGGGQEKGRRGGTENVAAIAGLAAALRCATSSLDREPARLAALRDRLEHELSTALPGTRFHAAGGRRLPSVSSAMLPDVDAESLLAALDLEGICASSGSACHAGTTAPSRVLLAMGLTADEAKATLRFSFGHTSQEADVDRLMEVLPPLAERVRLAFGAARHG